LPGGKPGDLIRSEPSRLVLEPFRVGASDVLLGHILDDTPVWISADQYDTQGNEPAVTHRDGQGGRVRHDGASHTGGGGAVVKGQR
jgi:uncharacterized protein (DUF779 family)